MRVGSIPSKLANPEAESLGVFLLKSYVQTHGQIATARALARYIACASSPLPMGGLPTWAVAAVFASLIGVVYGPAINVPFIFDDVGAIVQNESIVSLWPLIGSAHPGPLNPPLELPTSGRPLVNLSFAINYHLGGLNPAGYHAFSLLLHFFATMLLWAITRRTLRLPYFGGRFDRSAEWLALAVAILWSLHPLQTEAVIYATQRTELMMAVFYLATLYCSLRYWAAVPVGAADNAAKMLQASNDRGTVRAMWLALAVIACSSGMASKEVMVSAPLIVLLYERTFVAGSLANALRRSWPLYLGLAASWMLLLYLNVSAPHRDAAGFHLGPPAYVWWFTQSKVLFMYLKLVIWPWPLLIHYHMPYLTNFAEAWMYVIPLMLLGIIVLVLLWRNTPLGFLGTWFFALLSPTFVIPIITEIAAERRMYLALAVPVVILVVGGYRLADAVLRRRIASPQTASRFSAPLATIVAPAILLALIFCLVSSKRLLAYENEMNLWLEVMRYQPDDYMAHQSIGSYLEKMGNNSAAIEQYREAIRADPDASLAHYRLALLLSKQGAHAEAADQFAEAARILPKNAVLRNNLAFALYIAGRNEEAIEAFHATLELDPNYWTAHKNLGAALQKAGKYQESIASFQTALRLNPTAIDIYNDLANSYVRMNQRPKAVAMLEQGLELARASGDVETAKKFAAGLDANR